MDPAEEEEWRPVVGWEGLYEVSSLGRVRSLDHMTEAVRGNGKVVKTHWRGRILRSPRAHGYPVVRFSRGGGEYVMGRVHRLVCTAFHGQPPFEGAQVAHNDGDPGNPRADNLRWATAKENAADTLIHGTRARGERQGLARLTEAQVREIRTFGDCTQAELAMRYGVQREAIGKVLRGERWAHLDGQPYDGRSRLGRPGERNPAAKLTETEVRSIRASSDSEQAMADRYGVTKTLIRSIRKRKLWRHI
jgi:hypothetical protein